MRLLKDSDSETDHSLLNFVPMGRFRSEVPQFVRYAFVFAVLGGLAACAGSGGASGDPDVISQQAIQDAGPVRNAYALVQRLRPTWLEKRGGRTIRNPSDVVVYVDGSRRGGPDALRQLNVINVNSIEYLDENQATLRYGSGHDHGVIEVNLKDE